MSFLVGLICRKRLFIEEHVRLVKPLDEEILCSVIVGLPRHAACDFENLKNNLDETNLMTVGHWFLEIKAISPPCIFHVYRLTVVGSYLFNQLQTTAENAGEVSKEMAFVLFCSLGAVLHFDHAREVNIYSFFAWLPFHPLGTIDILFKNMSLKFCPVSSCPRPCSLSHSVDRHFVQTLSPNRGEFKVVKNIQGFLRRTRYETESHYTKTKGKSG